MIGVISVFIFVVYCVFVISVDCGNDNSESLN